MVAAGLIAVTLAVVGALYIRLRWRRSPRAYRAMIMLCTGYLVVGALLTAWVLHPKPVKEAEIDAANTKAVTIAHNPMNVSLHSSDAAYYLPNKYIGKVVSVTDGDTIDVALDTGGQIQAIRLEGIDAPESAQAFGSQSTQHLGNLCTS